MNLHLFGTHETGLHLAHRDKRSNHQARDDQQYQGERELDDGQHVSRAMPPRRIARQAASLLQRVEVEPSESHGGEEAEHQRGRNRDRQREEQDLSIDRGVVVDAREVDRAVRRRSPMPA